MGYHPTYLWTLPMFHCNGWCFPWTIVALAGTQVCTNKFDGREIMKAINKITSVQTSANSSHAPKPYITTLDPLLAEISKQSWKVTIVKIITWPKIKNAMILAIGGVFPIVV